MGDMQLDAVFGLKMALVRYRVSHNINMTQVGMLRSIYEGTALTCILARVCSWPSR